MKTKKRCLRCHKYKYDTEFKLKNNKVKNRTCIPCCAIVQTSLRCIHDKARCPVCHPQHFCSHGKLKCRMCMSKKDLLKHTLRTMVNSSTYIDRKRSMYDKEHIVDYNFLKKLLKKKYKNMECYYCRKTMSMNPKEKDDLITIERKDTSAGHNKNNVEFCCYNCNNRRVGTKLNVKQEKT